MTKRMFARLGIHGIVPVIKILNRSSLPFQSSSPKPNPIKWNGKKSNLSFSVKLLIRGLKSILFTLQTFASCFMLKFYVHEHLIKKPFNQVKIELCVSQFSFLWSDWQTLHFTNSSLPLCSKFVHKGLFVLMIKGSSTAWRHPTSEVQVRSGGLLCTMRESASSGTNYGSDAQTIGLERFFSVQKFAC